MSSKRKTDQIVQDILGDIPLRDKTAIANLDEEDVRFLLFAFDVCVTGKLGEYHEEGKDVMHRIWKVLQGTHRIRSVK